MSEVYRYNEADEGKPDTLAQLIEGIRASMYGRSKPTSLGFSSLDKSRRFNREAGWDFIMEPGIATSRKTTRKPVRHQHDLHELGFISESTVDSGDVGISTFFPYLDPNDPDPLGTVSAMQEVDLPDLKAMYAPDLDWYNALQKRAIEAMGVPARFLESEKEDPKRINFLSLGKKSGVGYFTWPTPPQKPTMKVGGIGRYYSESIDDGKALSYYSFEET